MERGDAGVAGIAPAGELGLEVEVDELGRDAMRKLKSNLAGFLDDRRAPSQVHHVHPGRGGQLLRVPQPRIKPRPFQDRQDRVNNFQLLGSSIVFIYRLKRLKGEAT